MKRFIDNVFAVLWDCVFFIAEACASILSALLGLLSGIFFRRSGKSWHTAFVSNLIRRIWLAFKKKTRASAPFRRILSLLVAAGLMLYLRPPYTWGKWERYEKGVASYYSWGFFCRPMTSGNIYWPWRYAAAHKTLPLGTLVKVKNLDNGKVIYVRILDRGPFVKGRIIDLTWRAGCDLGIVEKGLAEVEIHVKRH